MASKKPVKHVVKKVRILRKKAVAPAVAPEPINLAEYEELPDHEVHIEEIVEAPAMEQAPSMWQRIFGRFHK